MSKPNDWMTISEYHRHRDRQRQVRRKRALTQDAKQEIMAILILAQGRLNYARRPYHLICEMLIAYYHEWGWIT